MQIRVRGVVYPTVKMAAQKLDVTTAAIYNALDRGTLDRVGLRKLNRKPIPVEIDGETFPSLNQAQRKGGKNWNRVKKAAKQND